MSSRSRLQPTRRKAPPIELDGILGVQNAASAALSGCELPGSMVIPESGTAVEPKTGRQFFLDYPCDLKKGEKVTFILLLHRIRILRGTGSGTTFPVNGLQRKIPAGDRDSECCRAAAEGLGSGGRRVSAKYRHADLRPGGQGEHLRVLAGGAFAGRNDIEPDHPHGLFQATSGRVFKLVGRTARRESGAREFWESDAADTGSGRAKGNRRCAECRGGRCGATPTTGESVFVHL